jgi:hypothetical protein
MTAHAPAACLSNVFPESALNIALAFAGKRHASVGLVPAGQQLTNYAPPMVAICSDDFRCAGCPKESILT